MKEHEPAGLVRVVIPEPAWLELYRGTVLVATPADRPAADAIVRRFLPDATFTAIVRDVRRSYLSFRVTPTFGAAPIWTPLPGRRREQ